MHANLEITGTALARTASCALLGAAVSVVAFGAGWITRYTFREGLAPAILAFVRRLQDVSGVSVFGLPQGPNPQGVGGAGPPGPAATPDPEGGPASATGGGPAAVRQHRDEPSLARQLLAFIQGAESLPPADRKALAGRLVAERVVGLEVVFRIVLPGISRASVRDEVRRELTTQVLSLPAVVKGTRVEPEDVERIVFGWEITDVEAAFKGGGVRALAGLARGRPAHFFARLADEERAYAACVGRLSALDEASSAGTPGPRGSAHRPAPRLGAQGTGGRDESGPAPACPAGGTVTELGGAWACSVHGTRRSQYARGAQYTRYMGPVDRARQALSAGGAMEAIRCLHGLVRLCPQHAVAAFELGRALNAHGDFAAAHLHWQAWAGRMDKNAWACFMAAVASHAVGDVAAARRWVEAALGADPTAPPPTTFDRREFHVVRDKARQLGEMVARGVRHGDFSFGRDFEYPAGRCHVNMGLIRDAVLAYVRGYPQTHPLVARVKERKSDLYGRMKSTRDAKVLEGLKAQMVALRGKEQEIATGRGGPVMLRGLAQLLAQRSFGGCPAGGRYGLIKAQWLECTAHPGIFSDAVLLGDVRPASAEQEAMLSKALLNGVLNGEPRRKACFVLQKELVNTRPAVGPGAGVPLGATPPAGGRAMVCPEGGTFGTRLSPRGPPVVECSRHGSYQEYFSSGPQLARSP